MSDLNDFFRRGQNSESGKLPYFEDTHDGSGNYIGNRFGGPIGQQPPQQQAAFGHQPAMPVQGGAPVHTYMPLSGAQFGQPQQPQHVANPGNMIGGQPAYVPPQSAQGSFQAMSIEAKPMEQAPKSLYNIVIYEPKQLEEAQAVIDYLTRSEPAIINLDKIPESVSQRLLDFVCGATYALGGKVQRVAGGDNVFLLVPHGVDISTVAQ